MVKTIETTHDKSDIIIQLLNAQKARQFREEYLDLHVYEQAQIFTDLTEKQRARIYRYLTAEEVGDMFDAIEEEPEEVVNYFKEMTPQYAANVIDQMYTDNAVDILAYAQKKDLAKYLRLIPQEKAAEIREMLHYEDKTAGAIMSTEFVEIVGNQTVRSAMHVIKREADDAETIYYVYVIGSNEKLRGVLTLRDLLTHDDDEIIEDIMTTPVMSVQVSDDQAEVAQTIRDYNFLAIPVTDYDGKLIGIITVDDIIDVIDEESAEDYSGLAGVDTDENQFLFRIGIFGYLFCSGRCFSLLGQSGRSKRTQADVSACFRRDDVYRFFDRACNQRLHDYLFETFARSFFWLYQQLDGLYGR